MSDTPSHDDHWRRLAAELGLDVGPEPEQTIPAEEPPSVHAEPPPADEVEPAYSRRRRPEPVIEPPVEAEPPAAPVDTERPPPRGRRGRQSQPADDVGLFEADEAPPPEAEIEGSDVEAAAVPEVRPEAAEEASEEVADEPGGKRRRRRRSRRKKKGAEPAEAGEAASAEESTDEAPARAADDDDIDEPAELAANWNVPSWDDLIASLYRPER